MNARLAVWLGVLGVLGLHLTLRGHVGSPNVFFDGQAGPYPVHVVIRPPEVIPGLAEISVRVEGGGIERVTALPIKWNAGRQGARILNFPTAPQRLARHVRAVGEVPERAHGRRLPQRREGGKGRGSLFRDRLQICPPLR